MEPTWVALDAIKCRTCGGVLDLEGQPAFGNVVCPQCSTVTIVPAVFGDYLLLGQIGISDTGTVYEAFDLKENRALAIKILRPELTRDPVWVQNLDREARAAAALNHPHIAAVYAVGETEGRHFLAMELLRGGSLADRVLQTGKLSEQEVLDIGLQVADGLRVAHQRGLLHRDIRPGNVLLDEMGVPKLVEFGLSRPPALVAANHEFLAPEKQAGQPDDVLSDIFSLGATLLFALPNPPPTPAHAPRPTVAGPTVAGPKKLGTVHGTVPAIHSTTLRALARLHALNPAARASSWDEVVRELQQARQQLAGPVLSQHLPVPAAIPKAPRVAPAGQKPIGTWIFVLVSIGIVVYLWFNRESLFESEENNPPPVVASRPVAPPVKSPEVRPPPPARPEQPPPVVAPETPAKPVDSIPAEKPAAPASLAALAAFWPAYDFKGAAAKCAELSAGGGGAEWEQQVARLQLLVDFKAQLMADIERQPVNRSALELRPDVAIEGKLSKATEKQLIFQSGSSETITDWADLPPRGMVKLAEKYVASLGVYEEPAQRARRYRLLAAFCQQYDMADAARSYGAQAETEAGK